MAKPPQSSILSKCIKVMDILGQAGAPVRFSDIVVKADFAKSTAHRILHLLAAEHLIHYDDQAGAYRMGLKVVDWASRSLNNFDLPQAASAEMEQLLTKTEQHVCLSVLEGVEVGYVRSIDGYKSMPVMPTIGCRRPAHCTAAGKVIAAFLNETSQSTLLGDLNFPAITEFTIDNCKAFEAELKKAKAQGFAVSDREEALQIYSIAAPVLDHQGRVAGALSIWGPTYRVDLANLLLWAPTLTQACLRISKKLGFIE
ncbi:MAG: IclR family transcriptional regulator [bacterium]|nr:IclR family transcriptional regulator [bacterium]